jgi:23S rRNA (adenine2503-C2)-methyltransferase
LDLSDAEQAELLAGFGLPRYRGDQLNQHLLQHRSFDPDTWTNIPKSQRIVLAELAPPLLTLVREVTADSGATAKMLWRLADGELIESVLMRYGIPEIPASGPGRRRTTMCVSSQVGCGMGCPFCATGQGGLQRNLSAAEIIAQVLSAPKPNNVVFMGMGEPLANYPALLAAIRRMVSGIPLSARGITVSTVGMLPRMEQLATEGLPLTLALSLHAPDDELRDELCPLNQRYPVAEILAAAHHYFKVTSRRVSIEYALIKEVNDQAARAKLLAESLNRQGKGWVHVNLIPLNPTPGSKWTASTRRSQAEFIDTLERHGLPVTVRDTRGQDIDGACGQLAAAKVAPTHE